jgi:hypothetical protein
MVVPRPGGELAFLFRDMAEIERQLEGGLGRRHLRNRLKSGGRFSWKAIVPSADSSVS